jgi:dethiobiotin synthetase
VSGPGQAMTIPPLGLGKPGLFVTASRVRVGKTVAACALADHLVRRGLRVGACKPIAVGCRQTREGVISDDAELLAFAADIDPEVGTLRTVNPVAFKAEDPPAVTLARQGLAELPGDDYLSIGKALRRLDAGSQVMIVEGVGGLMTPIDARRSTLDLARAIDYPVVVVCSATGDTLNQTAMTCRLIRMHGLRLAGLIVNGFDPHSPNREMQDNLQWLGRLGRADVVACLPRLDQFSVVALDPDLQAAVDVSDVYRLCRPPRFEPD